ncbi:MAG: prohibitin family protein [Chloroflexi bacterium]|nr:prohibitin family protein [Chloroflexota bacterium]
MAVKAILNFVVTIAILVAVGGLGYIAVNSTRGRDTRLGALLAVGGFIVALVIAPLNAGLSLIEPNERGVVFRQIGSGEDVLRDPALQPGLRWVIPFVDIVIPYDVSQQSVTMAGSDAASPDEAGGLDAVQAISRDGQIIRVDVTVVYQIDPAQVNRIHREWPGGFENQFIVPVTRSEVRNAINNFGAEEIYSGGRTALESQIDETLREAFIEQGFLLTDIRIRNIEFSTEFANAIEQRQIAEQNAQRAVFLVQQAEQEAEQARTEAQGQADAVVIRAQGDANAIVIRAEAEAEALDLVNQILQENPNLIQYQYINELGEQVQLIIVPSDTPFLFDLEQLAATGAGADDPVITPAPPTPEPTPTESGEDDGTTP